MFSVHGWKTNISFIIHPYNSHYCTFCLECVSGSMKSVHLPVYWWQVKSLSSVNWTDSQAAHGHWYMSLFWVSLISIWPKYHPGSALLLSWRTRICVRLPTAGDWISNIRFLKYILIHCSNTCIIRCKWFLFFTHIMQYLKIVKFDNSSKQYKDAGHYIKITVSYLLVLWHA
jgi:hypothetical protein